MPELLVDLLLRLRDSNPARPAVELLRAKGPSSFESEWITLESWLDSAASTAGGLAARGVKPGDRVLLCLPTSRGFLDAFLGSLWLGALPVPLPSLEGFARAGPLQARVRGVLPRARPALIVADERTAVGLRKDAELELRAPIARVSELRGEPAPRAAHRPDEPAFLQYTSGSTGDPRGVIVTHGNLAANVAGLGAALRLTAADRQVTWLPLYHDMGLIGGLLTTVAHGVATSLLSPLEFLLRPAIWLQAVSQRRATLTVAPNFAYSLLARKVPEADLEGVDLAPLRAAVNGAEPIDPDTAEAFLQRFGPRGFRRESYLPVYGLAEATLAVSVPEVGQPFSIEEVDREALASRNDALPAPGGVRHIAVGRALPGHEIRICDPATGAELPERRAGEIVVRGPSVSPGVFGEPPRERPDEVATGDIGYLADGKLYVLDRMKDIVLVAGRNYAPSDIERVAESVPGLRRGRVVAFSAPDHDSGTEQLVIVAEVRGLPGAGIQQLVSREVAEQIGLTPKTVLLVPRGELSRTSSGKLRRRDARARWMAGELRPATRWRLLLRAVQGR